jgi:hypothetical protein
MMDNSDVKIMLIICLSILLLVTIIILGINLSYMIKVDNFQKTMFNLNDEQKCLHICGFRVGLENYNLCIEKCDRISERVHGAKV